MKTPKSNYQEQLFKRNSNDRIFYASGMAILMACLIIFTGCTNSETDSPEMDSNLMTTTYVSDECLEAGQEITDRFNVYEAALVSKDIDTLYNDLWTPDFREIDAQPGTQSQLDLDRDGYVEFLNNFYGSGGSMIAINLESYDRFVHGDAVYDFGANDNYGNRGGEAFTVNSYYFMRWKKGADGLWRVDKVLGNGIRGDISEVNRTTDAGPVVCEEYNSAADETGKAANHVVTNRLKAYIKALKSGKINEAYEFLSDDFRLLDTKLDVDRDGLYASQKEFFETGKIISIEVDLYHRFVYDNVVYDMGKSDRTVEINGVQHLIESYYAIRWEKGVDGVWRMDRIVNGLIRDTF